ncbi:DNA cytosine methyltransferase, partial [Acidimicrobiia bacterium]|nr:DNA cytosine methyltransferase [Acidimicrobiia bacterium]
LKRNFPHTEIDDRDIKLLKAADFPNTVGIVGGPPCQSWSIAGKLRGLDDQRGQVFLNYIDFIKEKKPLFFLAENVKGMLNSKNRDSFEYLISEFESVGYNFTYKLLNTADFGVPQTRERVIFVGYHKNLNQTFEFPEPETEKITLRDAIEDLKDSALPSLGGNQKNINLKILNHEYMTGSYSTLYMSRNRVRSWDEQSFTIQAQGRHAPIHPNAPKMVKVHKDHFIFEPNNESLYRRLSVREVARIQTFPDEFEFIYENVTSGYLMIGNAVPPKFAEVIAKKIKIDIENYYDNSTGDISSKLVNQ